MALTLHPLKFMRGGGKTKYIEEENERLKITKLVGLDLSVEKRWKLENKNQTKL